MSIPIIDLFAGPGGLGEGFSALQREGKPVFKIKLSIEKDEHAHQTLQLRAFFRNFPPGNAPEEYYDYLRGKIRREELFRKFPAEASAAAAEAWQATLGSSGLPKRVIHKRISEAVGQASKWILIGGPPCQAYSLVGRSRVIGSENGMEKYEADPKHRLYRHYLRVLAVHRPPVFVMENVKGLLSAKLKEESLFERILKDLARPTVPGKTAGDGPEYRLVSLVQRTDAQHHEPREFVVRSEEYGIPQARHRIIILGIRSDITRKHELLKPHPETTIEQVIGDLPRIRSGISKAKDSGELWQEAIRELIQFRWFANGALEPSLRDALEAASRRVGATLDRGAEFMLGDVSPERHSTWFRDGRLKGVCNHSSRGHIRADLQRYFFSSVFAREMNRAPLLEDFPVPLLPAHKNVEAALKETKFNDRFRVQLRHRPSTTIVAHIAKDGHYFIHYDPAQCRSLTVREAARLQTFPDNYFFEGPRTEQYKQVGNAVPPLLAKQIAVIVSDLIG